MINKFNDKTQIRKLAVDADCLDQRILKNVGHQKVDLVEWIFDRINLEPGSWILELCSGTGNQTMRMIESVGEKGFVVATDISEKALAQLKAKAAPAVKERFITVKASMDELPMALEESGLGNHRFDMVFCAYGLYYSEDPIKLLIESLNLIKTDGRVTIVGPFGPNNGQLFNLLEGAGVEIDDYVKYTSQDFMESVVIPFACRHFTNNTIHTLVNPVHWKSPYDVIDYWRNTTFFDKQKESEVERNVKNHFQTHNEFLNEKWVMLVKMSNRVPAEREFHIL